MSLNNSFSKWEVTIIRLESDGKTLYKVTRRLAEMSVAETKVFNSLEEAKRQLELWLRQ